MEDLTLLPLHEILIHNGFMINKDKSSKGNPVLHNEKETLVITKKGDHYLYFNTDGSNDRGNIINFCKNRRVDVKTLIKNYQNGEVNNVQIPKYFDDFDRINHRNIIKEFKNLNSYNPQKNQFFSNRGIYDSTIEAYSNSFKQDNYGNICFAHYKLFEDESTSKKIIPICGYTKRLIYPLYKDQDGNLRNKPLKNIHYGSKGLEILNANNDFKKIKQILFAESIIDALSFMQLYKDKYNSNEIMLISTGGNFHIEGIKPTLDEIFNLCKEARIITCFDNDKEGLKFTQYIEKYALETTKKGISIYKPFAKDVNDDLKLKQITQLTTLNTQTLSNYLENQLLNYQSSNETTRRKNILEKIRKIDALKPLEQSYKDRFNQIYKHKAIKKL
ncbi:toprim domain-containing protein [Helicobacter cappadocius]|uniref:Toprim domain-containing protein n=1 Tax=Helicobacter cappadocius TaxID=3063998 RepID=A0AA90PKQ0_9HELI|nr:MULTISPECIES: toprim domain-containing protein [unclassified Helicobacter]MDO7253927.1 toprim domain-containing protein [Helicobacter sp. faydin-H75]MDP2539776.1 toprim domain-containing protein [Helicobacter sp. faydin-H76]